MSQTKAQLMTPPAGDQVGAVKAGSGITIASDGTISASAATPVFLQSGTNIFSCNSTTGSGGGGWNFLVGQGAGWNLSTGCSNFVAGCSAGYALTTGSFNTFAGEEAGRFHTTGTANVFLGYRAGRNNTAGNCNLFLGSRAGEYGTGGIYNIVLGSYSGALLTNTSTYNVFVGISAGRNTNIGGDNVFLGSNAGYNNTAGNNNFFAGRGSGFGLTTGCGNIFLGQFSGPTMVGGEDNIFIGTCAAQYPISTTLNNAISIGSNSEAGCNRIFMGNQNHTQAWVNVPWSTTSDCRYKTCFGDVPVGLSFIDQLEPKKYNRCDRTTGAIIDERPSYGFFAQDVLQLEGNDPIIVDNSDPERLHLRETMLIPVLVQAIKELSSRVKELEELNRNPRP